MRQHDLDHLAATWPDVEAAAFETSLAGQRKVDPEVWGQLTPGHGNYTEERSDLFADMLLDDLVKAIREQRSH